MNLFPIHPIPSSQPLSLQTQPLSLDQRMANLTITGASLPPIVKKQEFPQNYLDVKSIGFSQASISSKFTDGRSLKEVTEQLIFNVTSPSDIPPIRVVNYHGKWITLDNRRLRVFLDALIDTVPVIVCHLNDPAISKEFWEKKSNKSLVAGGAIKNPSSKQHFTEGNFVFNKRILNWNVQQVKNPMPHDSKRLLPATFLNRDSYYRSFHELIFEEARAILQTGMEAKDITPLLLSLLKFKASKNSANPTEMRFRILENPHHELKTGDAFLLTSPAHKDLQCFGIASYSENDLFELQFSVKVIIDQLDFSLYPRAYLEGSEWEAKPLGSLITLQRMFEACSTFENRRETPLEQSIFSGKWGNRVGSAPYLEEFSQLNASQSSVVKDFLQIREGIKLVQGPPGTGKTTTINQLLRALEKRGERILVCAPSNKAIQILAERFLNDYPDVPMILIGIEKKLPANGTLHPIFFDLWSEQRLKILNKLSADLADFQIIKLLEGDLKFLHLRIDAACLKFRKKSERLEKFNKEISLYKLECINVNISDIQKIIEGYIYFISHQDPSIWKEVNQNHQISKTCRYMLSQLSMQISALQSQLQAAIKDSSEKGLEMQLLNHSRVIFSTLSISGQQRLKNMLPVDSLIIDEAGQAVEAETMIAFRTLPKKCLLIGDIQQLPATVISQEAEKLKFGRSMMERLEKDCQFPYAMLNMQYRMHPEICKFPSMAFYQNQLINTPNVINEPLHLPIFLAPYSFINVNGKEKRGPHRQSYINTAEAKRIKTILTFFHQQKINIAKQVGVITFYKAQADHIRDLLKGQFPEIVVNTVDGFQGGENEFIIISCVRANSENQIGFLEDEKRLNVALTRAKSSLIILGNVKTLAGSVLSSLLHDANQRKLLYDESFLDDLLVKKSTHPTVQSSKKTLIVGKQPKNSNYKTELCRHFAKPSGCQRGNQCSFAHGKAELKG